MCASVLVVEEEEVELSERLTLEWVWEWEDLKMKFLKNIIK